MPWILAMLLVAAVLELVQWREALQVLLGLALVLACLGSAWLCERRLGPGRSEGISAAVFGLAANVLGAGVEARLFLLPRGSSFDSWALWPLEWTFYELAGVVGVALTIRGLLRARKAWKLPALAGLPLSLTPIILAHAVFLYAVKANGLQDLW